MKKQRYSDNLKRLLSGELTLKDIHGAVITNGIRSAKANGDTELVARLEQMLKKKIAMTNRQIKEDKRRDNERMYSSLVGKEVEEFDVYSARQERIIRGQIPYERASESDYLRIAETARGIEDYALASLNDETPKGFIEFISLQDLKGSKYFSPRSVGGSLSGIRNAYT